MKFTGRVVKSISIDLEIVRAIEVLKLQVGSFSSLVEEALRSYLGLTDDNQEHFLVVVNLDRDAYKVVSEYRKWLLEKRMEQRKAAVAVRPVTMSEAIVELIKQRNNFQKVSQKYQELLHDMQLAIEEILGISPETLMNAYKKGNRVDIMDFRKKIGMQLREW